MGFFLVTHNGVCGMGKHFCDQQRDHGLSVLLQPKEARVRSNIIMLDWPEVITWSGTRSHDRKWYQKLWPEVVPEVLPWVMTVSGTWRHDHKCYRKTWPEVVLEAITYGQIRYMHDEFIANQQTDRVFYNWKHSVADISSYTLSAGLSSGNCFDTGRSQNPESRTRTRKWTRRVHSTKYNHVTLKVLTDSKTNTFYI